MQGGFVQETAPAAGAGGASTNSAFDLPRAEEEDDDVVERDPTGRFSRYDEVVVKGRFKHVYKGFDEKDGIDVAWSRISGEPEALTQAEIATVIREMERCLTLDHPNIMKCLKCWAGGDTINLISEWTASGSLRQYRRRHKHLELKALKKWGRQILRGLAYLHSQSPCVVHGDLQCDRIYVNGHSGEIKIGDFGLATLLPCGGENGIDTVAQGEPADDIYAFGLCMLELVTLQTAGPRTAIDWQARLQEVPSEEARSFIAQCLRPEVERPSAAELLQHSFLQRPVGLPSQASFDASSHTAPVLDYPSALAEFDSAVPLLGNGKFKGEDYRFHFSGEVVDGKAVFCLVMDRASADDDEHKRTVTFSYDPLQDTSETVAQEIADTFGLGETDRGICAAAIKEWMAREMPGVEDSV